MRYSCIDKIESCITLWENTQTLIEYSEFRKKKFCLYSVLLSIFIFLFHLMILETFSELLVKSLDLGIFVVNIFSSSGRSFRPFRRSGELPSCSVLDLQTLTLYPIFNLTNMHSGKLIFLRKGNAWNYLF